MDGEGVIVGGYKDYDGEDGEIVDQIKELFDICVCFVVVQDGGDIMFYGFECGVVYLYM